ncbi:third triple-gene-block protein [Burdock mottle virus]|uniref:Third triple-gene-block protein n=1 Tax=Burdock mottle virus TaxID=1324959 RepID=S6AVG8_9VIRU|nr:third triple-gene-block protein [Burdock mottle virus]BAN62708.1 third triple-gene-block protein [Burdock mottle virus]
MAVVVRFDVTLCVLYIVCGIVVVCVVHSPVFQHPPPVSRVGDAVFLGDGYYSDQHATVVFGNFDASRVNTEHISSIAKSEHLVDIVGSMRSFAGDIAPTLVVICLVLLLGQRIKNIVGSWFG